MEPNKTYHVWVTALSETYVEQLVGKLVRRGYQISPMGNQLVTASSDNPCAVLAFSMTRPIRGKEEALTHAAVLDEAVDVMKRLKMYYYSIVVAESSHCTWMLGNLSIEQAKKDAETVKKGTN